MSGSEKNKVDAVVDEIIESKRLRQGVFGLVKIAIGGAFIFGLFIVLAVAFGWVS